MDNVIDRIKTLIDEKNDRFRHRGGSVRFAGIDGPTVKIAPEGFCWR